jgi:hypothetical protein
MLVDAETYEQQLEIDEAEPLDPPLDNSGTIHEKRHSTKLGGEVHRSQIPSIYVSDDDSFKTWRQSRRAYRRHRIGEYHSPKPTTLQRRSRQDYRRLLETDRQLQERYESLSTALLSLRVPPMANGSYLPPLVALDALMDSLSDVMAALRYRLREYDWEYARVVAGTDEFATPHIHLYLWIDGQPAFEELAPVVEKFVEKCSIAPDEGHGNRAGEGALTIRYEQEITPSGETAGIVYIAAQLPHIAFVEEMDNVSLDWGAVSHATTRQLIACSYKSRPSSK